jgi:hypothetical protein
MSQLWRCEDVKPQKPLIRGFEHAQWAGGLLTKRDETKIDYDLASTVLL